jgi:hypothetical protein
MLMIVEFVVEIDPAMLASVPLMMVLFKVIAPDAMTCPANVFGLELAITAPVLNQNTLLAVAPFANEKLLPVKFKQLTTITNVAAELPPPSNIKLLRYGQDKKETL